MSLLVPFACVLLSLFGLGRSDNPGWNISSFSVSRFGSSLTYTVVVERTGCSVSWSGVAGVWKLGDFLGSCGGTWDLFVARMNELPFPPFPVTFENASDWAVLALGGHVFDTRYKGHTSWDKDLQEAISVLELLINNSTWQNPDLR